MPDTVICLLNQNLHHLGMKMQRKKIASICFISSVPAINLFIYVKKPRGTCLFMSVKQKHYIFQASKTPISPARMAPHLPRGPFPAAFAFISSSFFCSSFCFCLNARSVCRKEKQHFLTSLPQKNSKTTEKQ